MQTTLIIMLFLTATLTNAGVVGKEVQYTSDSLTMKGYIAYDDAAIGKRPGVLVVHEWWGHNAYVRKRAEMLAGLGYVALAVDMYGNGKQADHPDDAGKFASEVMSNMPGMKARFNAAMDVLKSDEHVDSNQIAAIGYCFGGAVVLNMAREGADLKAVVSFHGSLGAQHPAVKGAVKAKILVCHGAEDKFASTEDIATFKSEMKNAGVDLKFVTYPGALHAFTNPDATELGKKFNMPIAYNEKADKQSWAEMQKFFTKVLKK
jgi:dienelactone hydrolase